MFEIKKIFDQAENIGVIGSPSSTTELTVDILGTAINKSLVGKFNLFHYFQEASDHYALGQITEIQMQNIWTQDATMRGIIRQKGRVDPVTEKQDIHIAKMHISSVFAVSNDSVEPSIFGTVPSTGTRIKLLDNQLMDNFFLDFKEEIFYLGKVYGTTINLPMWFKHFGKGKGGAGEAYHIGVFGKTGSGKSWLSKMMIMGYAKHPNMTIFLLDPQGEFSRDFKKKEVSDFIERGLNRKLEIYNLHNLVLTNWDLFEKILSESIFFYRLGVKAALNRTQAAEQVIHFLKTEIKNKEILDTFTNPYMSQKVKISQIHKREVFEKAWISLGVKKVQEMIYSTAPLRKRMNENYTDANKDEFYEIWKQISGLFKYESRLNAISISELVKKIGEKTNSIIIINLSEADMPEDIYWSENIKLQVIGEFIRIITGEAEKRFKENQVLNSLILLDEAHRLAPREKDENEELEKVKSSLVDAIRTTRKYGLGWMFISQTLSSLDRRILEQVRIYIFGYGLGWGIERQALREIIGGAEDAIRLYQMFKDPQSGFGKQEYPFMAIGPISPLSFSGSPLFFNTLDYPKEFLRISFKE